MAETRMIPKDRIKKDPNNPRKERDRDADDDLRASLAKDGQINPLLVREILGSEDVSLVAGERRFDEGCELGFTEFLCQIVEADELTIQKMKLLDNLQRLNPSDIDTALYATELMQKHGWSPKRLARELSVGQSVVSRWVTMANKLTPGLRSSGLPSRTLYLLASKVKNPEDQLALAKRVKDEHLTVEQLSKILSSSPKKSRKTVFRVKGGKVTVEASAVLEALTEALSQAKRS
jgi:ParB family chromosome partitioning protein